MTTGIVEIDRIRARVAAALPEYMIPAAYVAIDEIPITAHGKIDRKALPEPEIRSGTDYREPGTDTERVIAELFGDLLGRDKVGADDSFFELGGHSLLATKLVAAVRSRCGVDIGVQEVFELGTVGGIAAHIDELAAAGGRPDRPAMVRDRARRAAADVGRPAAAVVPVPHRRTQPGQQHPVRGPAHRPERRRGVRRRASPMWWPGTRSCAPPTARSTARPIRSCNPADRVPVRRARGADEEWLQAELDRRTPLLLRPGERPADPGRGAARPGMSTCCRWWCTTSPPTTGRPACCSPTC